MYEYTLIITPTVSLDPPHYEYNIEGYYEVGQTDFFKHVTLDSIIEDIKDNTELAEGFQYIIEWKESYEKGRTNEALGLAAIAIYNFLNSHGYDVIYKYE